MYSRRFSSVENMLEIASATIDGGINALNFSRHENLIKLVDRIIEDRLEMKLIPMIFRIPLKIEDEPVPIVRTEATLFENIDWMKSQQYREFVQTPMYKEVEAATPFGEKEIDKLNVDKERLERVLRWFDGKGCVKLAMTCVETFALTHRMDLIEEALEVFNNLGFTVCAGAHIAEVFEILEKERINFKAYYAPLNKIGFMMFPTQNRMLKHILKIEEPFIAIKPLAGGRIKPKEAFDYIFNLRENVVAMVGLSSVQEVEHALEALSSCVT